MLSDSRTTPAILARDLTKVYRLYQRPAYRLLDLLGLCPDDAQHFSRHAALSDVNIEIERGQKVAIIGRNVERAMPSGAKRRSRIASAYGWPVTCSTRNPAIQ